MSDDPLVELVLEEPAERVNQLIDALEHGRLTLTSGRATIEYTFVHGPRSVERMAAALTAWRAAAGEGTEALLARTLRGHLAVRRTVEAQGPRCELVWTGRGEGIASVRSTLPVVLEMLDHAGRDVMVVAYSVWLGFPQARAVLERLAALSSSGVDVTFILDAGYRDGHSIREVREAWPPGRRPPTIWSWRYPADDVAKLHAKVLVVDADDVLVTSANLTGHGLTENLEVGLRVRGKPAADAAAHLRRLIDAGEFVREAWG